MHILNHHPKSTTEIGYTTRQPQKEIFNDAWTSKKKRAGNERTTACAC